MNPVEEKIDPKLQKYEDFYKELDTLISKHYQLGINHEEAMIGLAAAIRLQACFFFENYDYMLARLNHMLEYELKELWADVQKTIEEDKK
jgi:hypothetical protein